MILPKMTSFGTDFQELLDGYHNARMKVIEAINSLELTRPNPRDYITDFIDAQNDHARRWDHLISVRDQLADLELHCDDLISAKAARQNKNNPDYMLDN